MKKRIISVLLSALLLFACFAPAVAAAECEDTSHEAFHAAVATLRSLAGENYENVWFGNTDVNENLNAIKTMLERSTALAESVKSEEDYTYFNTAYTKYRSRAAVYTDEYVPAYDAAVTALGTNNANVATKDYYDKYYAMKANYDKFNDDEKVFVNKYKNFAALPVPTYETGEKSEIKAIKNATTTAALDAAVTAAETKSQSDPTYFTSSEQQFIGRSRLMVNLIKAANELQQITPSGIPERIKNIHTSYNQLTEDEKTMLSGITDSNIKDVDTAYNIANAYLTLSSPSENSGIIQIYKDMIAFTKHTTYFSSALISNITSAYEVYMNNSTVTVGYSYYGNRLDITISFNANSAINSTTINVSPANTSFTLSHVNDTIISSISNTLTVLGGTAVVTQNNGITTISVTGGTLSSGTITVSYVVPSNYIGKSTTFHVSGNYTLQGTTESSTFANNLTVFCCSHRNGANLTYVQKVIQEPTCSSEGVFGYFCSICGARLTTADGVPQNIGVIPTTPHIPGDKVTAGVHNVAATCTTNGSQYFECSVCHAVITTPVVQPASHKIDTSTIYWNSAAGAWYATCPVSKTTFNASAQKSKCECEKNYGKSFAVKTYTKSATCGENGYSVYQCNVCGVSWVETEETSSASHVWGAWTTTKAANCTETGISTRTCTVCGQTQTEVIPALGHNFDPASAVVIVPSTCTTHGTAQMTCSRCNQTVTTSLPLADHSYDEGKVTLEPTCSATGIKTFTCTVCNATKTETIAIDPDAHKFGEAKVIKEATCISEGLKVRTCEYCGKTEEEVIPHSGHTWGEATTKGKVTTKTCLVCHTVWSQTKTNKSTTLNITVNDKFTLNITDSVLANKDIGFIVDNNEKYETGDYKEFFDTFLDNTDKKYDCSLYGAYTASLIDSDENIKAGSGTNLVIDLGKDYAKKEILVKYIDDDGSVMDVSAERDGSSIIIKGEDFAKFSDKTFIVLTSNKKAGGSSPVVPIIICVVIVVIAGVAIVLLLKQKERRDDLV